MATFGERLRARRYYKGFTQSELARAIGLTSKSGFRTIQSWEHDESRPRYRSKIDALGRALDVSPEWLLHGSDGDVVVHEAPEYEAPAPEGGDVILIRLERIEKQLNLLSEHLGLAAV